jgi:hypothetical protein
MTLISRIFNANRPNLIGSLCRNIRLSSSVDSWIIIIVIDDINLQYRWLIIVYSFNILKHLNQDLQIT